MPSRPARFEFGSIPQPEAVEAAARRRMRLMERAFPSVLEWDATVQPAGPRAGQETRFAARVQGRVVGGATLHGDACGGDTLAALRLAFNALEDQLACDQASARKRASAWLARVRQRVAESTARR